LTVSVMRDQSLRMERSAQNIKFGISREVIHMALFPKQVRVSQNYREAEQFRPSADRHKISQSQPRNVVRDKPPAFYPLFVGNPLPLLMSCLVTHYHLPESTTVATPVTLPSIGKAVGTFQHAVVSSSPPGTQE
jgi:hypothetical protein